MSVLEFKRPEKPEPHLQGTAQCLACGHRCEAAAPVGTRYMDCGACGLHKLTWRNAVEASPGDSEFKCCHCDGIALTALLRNGRFHLLCMGCGVDHTEAVFG